MTFKDPTWDDLSWDEEDTETVYPKDYIEWTINSIISSDPQVVLKKVQAIADEVGKNYHWHHEEPVWTVRDHAAAQSWQIKGKIETPFYEDEWAMVAILRAISGHLPFLACTARDLDGEFMLNEVADELLKTLLIPEATNHRVFIYRGYLHVIPESVKVGDVVQGLQALKESTQAPEAIEQCIFTRADQCLAQPKHAVNLRLPPNAIAILHHRPWLANMAVNALSADSPDDLDLSYAGQQQNHFCPTEKMFTVPVAISRPAFAALACRPFDPLPVSSWSFSSNSGSELSKRAQMDMGNTAHVLGMKMAVGLDILRWRRPELFFASPEDDSDTDEEAFDASLMVPSRLPEEESLHWMEEDIDTKTTSLLQDDFLQGTNKPGKIASHFLNKKSNMTKESIKTESDDQLTSTDYESDSEEDASFLDSNSECDSFDQEKELIERELLEAIKYDPDLFMRVTELCKLNDDDPEYQKLFQKLSKIDIRDVVERGKNAEQKGMADLSESAKKELEDYKANKAKQLNEKSTVESEDSSDSSGSEEIELYTPTMEVLKKKGFNPTVTSDCEDSEDCDYIDMAGKLQQISLDASQQAKKQ